jgi:putative ABC transport system permease protein
LTSWSDNENTRQVAVVSESLARALAPDGNILERRVRYGSDRAQQDIVIVGVVANMTLGNPRQPAPAVMYRPALQMGRFANYPGLVIATDRAPSAVAAGVRQALKEGRREYAHEIRPLDEVLARAPSSERMSAMLAGAVAGLGVVLALIGVYGTLAYAVSRRTREIGVRVAVGAAPGAVARTVLREGFVLTAVGLAIGLPAAFVLARTLGSLMFGVSPADPFTFAATTAFFLVIGLAAGAVPALRAARVDPVVALRAE